MFVNQFCKHNLSSEKTSTGSPNRDERGRAIDFLGKQFRYKCQVGQKQRKNIRLEKIHSETKKKNKKTKTKTKTNDKAIASCNVQVESCPKKIECLNKCRAARY